MLIKSAGQCRYRSRPRGIRHELFFVQTNSHDKRAIFYCSSLELSIPNNLIKLRYGVMMNNNDRLVAAAAAATVESLVAVSI